MAKEFLAKIRFDRRVTIPISIRNLLKLSDGDFVKVCVEKEKENKRGE